MDEEIIDDIYLLRAQISRVCHDKDVRVIIGALSSMCITVAVESQDDEFIKFTANALQEVARRLNKAIAN